MTEEKATSFPMLPVSQWWALRQKFKQSIPGIVTDNYLATALNMQVRSARNNVLPYLKDFGLVDDEGRMQDLSKAWRDDEHYPEVCKKMRETIYPEELIAAVPNPSEEREGVERWFANRTGAGDRAVKRMAAIYVVISEADISKRPEHKAKKQTGSSRKRTSAKVENHLPSSPAPTPPEAKVRAQPALAASAPAAPGVSINLEIHISADATPDQIDRIFESMAKHIYNK